MTIKAQRPYWTAEMVRALVAEALPVCVRVEVEEVRVGVAGARFEVTLGVPWWRRRWARRRRAALTVLASEALWYAPALVRVGWR